MLSDPKRKGGFAFLDIGCFNKALLNKQRWRLINNKSLLISFRILKAKYVRTSPYELAYYSYIWFLLPLEKSYG